LRYANDDEKNTCLGEDNMKMTLIKGKVSESDSQKHENDTRENKGE